MVPGGGGRKLEDADVLEDECKDVPACKRICRCCRLGMRWRAPNTEVLSSTRIFHLMPVRRYRVKLKESLHRLTGTSREPQFSSKSSKVMYSGTSHNYIHK